MQTRTSCSHPTQPSHFRYLDIVTYKTAYYSFVMPVACGLHLAGVTDPAAFSTASDILLDMGRYFQIQDDYLDCFGDPEVIGETTAVCAPLSSTGASLNGLRSEGGPAARRHRNCQDGL